MKEFELIAKTFQGLEEVLAQELTELGANNVQIGRRMVSFTGDMEMMYRANFCLRTAVRILKPIKHFRAKDADQVYEAVKEIDWSEYLDLGTTFSVDSVVFSEEFRHSKFVAYKVKDAIVDYFREKEGKRPNISITQPDIRLNMHIAETDCTLSLDSSGDSLHLRGYRVASCEAPINEVLAAGLIRLTGWDFKSDFIDPFCGSGTIAIEAALMARNIYPGLFRKSFGFEKWKDFDRDLLDRIYNDDSEERDFEHKIYAYDINHPTLAGALANAKAAGVADVIEFAQQDFRKFTQPAEKAIIVTNPPYGERLMPPDIQGLYRAIGERLKHEFRGGDAWIISSKQECFDEIGLRPSVKIQLFNGSLDCEFRKYQLFDGKLDAFRAAGGEVKTFDDRRRNDERKRSRTDRPDFSRRFNREEEEVDDEVAREYALLRSKHMEFERNRVRKERRENGGYDRSRRSYREDDFGRKPYRDRESNRRSFRDRDGEYDRRPYRDGGYGRKPYRDRESNRRSFRDRDGEYDRRSYRDGGYGRKPFRDGERDYRSFKDGERGRKPFKGGNDYDKDAYKKKPYKKDRGR